MADRPPQVGDTYTNPNIQGAVGVVEQVTDDEVILRMRGPGIPEYPLSIPRSVWGHYIKGATRVDLGP